MFERVKKCQKIDKCWYNIDGSYFFHENLSQVVSGTLLGASDNGQVYNIGVNR